MRVVRAGTVAVRVVTQSGGLALSVDEGDALRVPLEKAQGRQRSACKDNDIGVERGSLPGGADAGHGAAASLFAWGQWILI